MIEEIGAIDQALEEQRRSIGMGFWKPFQAAGTNKKVMWRLFLGSALFFWQNGSGINAINYYSPTVFKSVSYLRSVYRPMLTTSVDWCQGYQHKSVHHGYIRCREDSRDLHLAALAY